MKKKHILILALAASLLTSCVDPAMLAGAYGGYSPQQPCPPPGYYHQQPAYCPPPRTYYAQPWRPTNYVQPNWGGDNYSPWGRNNGCYNGGGGGGTNWGIRSGGRVQWMGRVPNVF